MKHLYIILALVYISQSATCQTSTDNSLWLGHYQESATNNPEDPMPGFIYLSFPDNGTFEGQLVFSYSGCDGHLDVGNIEGTVNDGRLEGTWSGHVDNKAVGGSYTGRFDSAQNKYIGSYTNSNGKQKIECDEETHYYVAATGSWQISPVNNDDDFNITTDINIEHNDFEISWNRVSGADYRYIFIDRECLEETMDLEECTFWAGESRNSSVVYGRGGLPAKPLVVGNTYTITIFAIDLNGQIVKTGNKEFVYQ